MIMINQSYYLCLNKKVMQKLNLAILLFLLVYYNVGAQISFNLEVDQSVDGNELVLDFMVYRPVGSTPFAFGSSNFSIYVNSAALNVPGLYKDPAFDGLWDNGNNPVNYYDLSVGHNNSNYVNMNINYIVGSPGTGSTVPEGRTRIGRMRIPITDPTQCNSITWRIPPLAIQKHDGTSIKNFANFVNSSFCLPLCANPPVFTQATASICNGQSYVFTTQISSTCSLVVVNGSANAQITNIDTSSHLIQFSGVGNLTLRFTGPNGCFKDTTVHVHPNPSIVSYTNLCSGSLVEFQGSDSNLNWFILGYDSTLSFSDTTALNSQNFSTQINGYGSFTLAIENTTTNCIFDTILTIRPIEIVQPSPIALCNGDTFTIQLNQTVNSAQWIFPNHLVLISGGTSLDSFIVLRTQFYGTYTVFVQGVNTNGCLFNLNYVVSVDTPLQSFNILHTTDNQSQTILVSPYEPVYWYFNDTLLNIIDDTLHITQSGNYYAVYINNCGIFSSETLIYAPTLKPLSLENSFTLYPNPNDGNFYIQVLKTGFYKIRIYDGVGKLVYQDAFQGEKYYLQLKEITEGVYTLEVEGLGTIRWVYMR